MVTVLERKREILGMPCNIGTTGEGHPIAAHNLVLRRINIRDPQRDIGVYEHDFNQNILLDQTNRCDFYQGRHSFLISPTRNSNGRRDYGNFRNGADYAQKSLGTCTRNIDHGTHLLMAHYRIQERVGATVNQYLQGNRVIHVNYRSTSDHTGDHEWIWNHQYPTSSGRPIELLDAEVTPSIQCCQIQKSESHGIDSDQ